MRIYHAVTDTVGGPSLRLNDNLIQGAIVIGATLIGAAAGYVWHGGIGAMIGGAGMMILSALISGLVLMVLGWIRTARL
jgi:hypothetical protein